jgi:Flp pilus assembly protein TadB
MRNLVIAMVVAWVIHIAYLISLALRQRRLQRETEELRQTLERLERAAHS